jgi:mannosyltransferase OCH1-like enzyme
VSWNLTKIPKIVHFFWDNRPLSFLRWMSMCSFSVLNPDWKIKMHMTHDAADANWSWANNKHSFESGDYRSWLDRVDNLEVIEENSFPGMHGVHQSDILRSRYLINDGGLWSDVDILYYRSMNDLTCNLESNFSEETGLCVSNSWLPIAFMLAEPGSKYFRAVYEKQLTLLPKKHRAYQVFGTGIYRSVLARGFSHFKIDKQEVYQHHWRDHERIFNGHVDNSRGVGIHWFGGSTSAAKVEPKMTHENWESFPLSKLIEIGLG